MNYLERVADEIRREVAAGDLPEDDPSPLFLVYAVLLLAKGSSVTAQDVHNAWVAWTSPRDPTHESLVPFEQLSAETRSEDSPFVAAIRAVATRHTRSAADEGATD